MKKRTVFFLLWVGIFSAQTWAQQKDCPSELSLVSGSLGKSPRFQVSPEGERAGACVFSYQDTGLSNYPIGQLSVDFRSTPAIPQSAKADCQNVLDLGEEARFCQVGERTFSMFVRRGSIGISLAFTTWPDGYNTVLSESRKLVTGLLGPYQPAALAPVPLKATGNLELDRVESTLAASADGGNTNASLMLGFLLNFPEASHLPDYPAAAYWYGKARDAGNAQAEHQLALLYLQGQGVPKNESVAVKLLKAASDQAYEPAVTRYGELILDDNLYGNGMYYAEPILKKAVSLGSTDALYDLAMIAWADTRTTHTTGVYHAEQLFQQSAAKGNCKAYLGLGALYFNGDGVQQDGAAARTWFMKAKQCFRTSPSLAAKADHWILMIDSGRLPSKDSGQMPSKDEQRSLSEGWNVLESVVAVAAATVAFETALHQNDPPQTKEEGEAELKNSRCSGQSMMRSVYPPPGSIVGSPAWFNSIPECR